ncbi:hypothetical protein NPX13_g8909 [Xylaria arbuscula]|uniref:Uncharacterized protein n=1 Tax=Xylaria arbuscula TaxID=114810 RepID=A0A9W8N7I8_9PEZI|nr:hypothetical protein NPX13_g8909 [Xylaria arbuscula]
MSTTDCQRAWLLNEETDTVSYLLPSGDTSVHGEYEVPGHGRRYTAEDSSAPQEMVQPRTRYLGSFPWEGHREWVDTTSAKNPSPGQKPKAIQRSSPGPAIKIFLFQLPALAFTSAFLVLYAKKIHWNPTLDQLCALLDAAKVHESLIVVSSFHTLYYHIRCSLLGRSGIPIGLITAPFQLTSPFYHFSSEFWSGVRGIKPHSAPLSLLILVIFVLNILVGASSGIIVLPKPDWRILSLREILELANGSLAGYGICYATDLFPSVVDLIPVPRLCLYGGENAIAVPHCPYNDIIPQNAAIDTYFHDIYLWPELYNGNLTISCTDKRSISVWRNSADCSGICAATAPSSCVESISSLTNGDSRYWGPQEVIQYSTNQQGALKLTAELHANRETIATKQPRVITQCSQESRVQKSEGNSPYYEFAIN